MGDIEEDSRTPGLSALVAHYEAEAVGKREESTKPIRQGCGPPEAEADTKQTPKVPCKETALPEVSPITDSSKNVQPTSASAVTEPFPDSPSRRRRPMHVTPTPVNASNRSVVTQIGRKASPIPSLSMTLKKELARKIPIKPPLDQSTPKYFSTPSPLKRGRALKKKKPFPKGAEMMGLVPGFLNHRQMTWERMNNDRALDRKIKTLKSRFSANMLDSTNAKEAQRTRRARRIKFKLDHRDSIERCSYAFNKFCDGNYDNFSLQILAHIKKGKNARRILFKKINYFMNEYSIEGIEIFRFWFELIFHPEKHETLERQFSTTLVKLFKRYHRLEKDATLMLMSFIERRLCSQPDFYDSDKTMPVLRFLYDLGVLDRETVLQWKLGKLDYGGREELRCVPNLEWSFGDLSIARSKVLDFIGWAEAVENEKLDRNLRIRDAAKMDAARSGVVVGPFGPLPTPKWAEGMQRKKKL